MRDRLVAIFNGKSTDLSRCVERCERYYSMPCQNEGTCVDDINWLRCFCVLGFTGVYCETSKFCVSLVKFYKQSFFF